MPLMMFDKASRHAIGDVIETHKHKGDFKELWVTIRGSKKRSLRVRVCLESD
jgi:hypothetical protein